LRKPFFIPIVCVGLSLSLLSSAWAESDAVKLRLTESLADLMTEIRFEDREPDEPTYLSRILVLGERMRIDFGQDDQGFILFDRKADRVWHVSPSDRRLTRVAPGGVEDVWPKNWVLSQESIPGESSVLSQVRLNDALCVEFKAVSLLEKEAALLRDYRRLLASNRARAWGKTPEDLREPCWLAIEVQQAGIEYVQGLPLAVRYWDGRSRVLQGYDKRLARPDLFELPSGALETSME
jgi:hypothetical protein